MEFIPAIPMLALPCCIESLKEIKKSDAQTAYESHPLVISEINLNVLEAENAEEEVLMRIQLINCEWISYKFKVEDG